ncbi:MAG: hypothetical protein H8E98_03745 [Bacteroidetes bacterium]|nr:hypothetical protein [Bacteroidota bacterium]
MKNLKDFSIGIVITLFLIIGCGESNVPSEKSAKEDYKCTKWDGEDAINRYMESSNMTADLGLDYYENLSDSKSCKFTYYGSVWVGDGMNGFRSNYFFTATYVNKSWYVRVSQ